MKAEGIKIDKIDRRLIFELENDCSKSASDIAKRIGISKQTLGYRVERLRKAGVIKMFSIILDEARLGYTHFDVWLQLGMADDKIRKELEEYLYKHPGVNWLATFGTPFDYAFGMMATDVVSFYRELMAILERFPGIVQNHYVTITRETLPLPRSHLIGGERKTTRAFFGESPKKARLDETDLRILNELSSDSRMPTVSLAKKAGVSPASVKARIRRMEEEGVIRGYRAIIEPTLIGLQPYELLLSTQNMDGKAEREFDEYCRNNPYILLVHKVIGHWDIDVFFDTESMEHYQHMMTEIRFRFGRFIKDYQCAPSLRTNRLSYLLIP